MMYESSDKHKSCKSKLFARRTRNPKILRADEDGVRILPSPPTQSQHGQ